MVFYNTNNHVAMYQLPSDLWRPQVRGIMGVIQSVIDGKSPCLYSPTGGGKTRCAIELIKWAESNGLRTCFYVNRKLLVSQTASRYDSSGLYYGIRAADYDDCYNIDAPHQIVSADTEQARVFERDIWKMHDAKLIIVDEAHIQRTETMRRISDHYKSRGASVVGLTATPVGLSEWYEELIVSGRLHEYRECKALVPAIIRSIEQPDLSKVKRNKTGEYILDGKKKAIYTQSIVGSVIDRWKKYNPDARPTMLFAPGKPESVWFTEQFHKIGVNWCHVDATDAIIDGERRKLTRPVWDEIISRFKSNNIKGLSSRFKLREGVDVPNIYHCILATPIGSLASYIQTVGRVLRYSPETSDHVLVTDHGGNYLRHGSPNHDRDWKAWWSLPEHVVSEWHTNEIRDRKTPEPIRCPKCEGERAGGAKCPHCGYEHKKSQRHVIQEDGKMVVRDGNLIKPRYVKSEPNTQQLWDDMYFSWKNSSKARDKSFAQLEGFFAYTYGYHPPRDMNHMPIQSIDWCRKIRDPVEIRNETTIQGTFL